MIPGIKGSFSTGQSIDKKKTTINFGFKAQSDHHARRVMLQSFADWLDNPAESRDGNFRVFIVAEAPENDDPDERYIKGNLYLYPKKLEPESEEDRYDLPWFKIIHEARSCEESYRRGEIAWDVTRHKLNQYYLELQSVLNEGGKQSISKHFYNIEFKVNARGLTKLKLVFPENIPPEKEYPVVRQAFYYIKYSLHSHKHHHSQEDSLTTIVRIQNGEIEKQHGLKMVGQLKRELTAIKRTFSNGGTSVFGDEQGIIAYMRSLVESLRFEQVLEHDLYTREMAYLNSLSDSFQAQSNKREKRIKSENDVKTQYRVYIAIIISLLSLLWLSAFREYFDYTGLTKIRNTLNLSEMILVILTILICFSVLYLHQVNKAIQRKLDSDGLQEWLNNNYQKDQISFNKLQLKKVGKILLNSCLGFCVVLLVDFITNERSLLKAIINSF